MRTAIAALCALFFASAALAQNTTVKNHAFAIGKGPGVSGYTSLLCTSGQLAIGSATDPVCAALSGDATMAATGVVTLATVNANVGTFGSASNCVTLTIDGKGRITAASQAACTGGITQLTGDVTAGPGSGSQAATLASVITAGGPTGSATATPIITYDAKGRLTVVSSATVTPAVTSVTGFGTGIAAALQINVGSAGAPVLFNGAGGTPSSITLTNGTGLPIATGVSGLGTGIATALQVNVGSAGAPVLFNGAGGTPSSITLTNGTGLPISTGVSGLGTGCATFLGTPSSANLRGCLNDESGTGLAYFQGGDIGTPSAGVITNFTGTCTNCTSQFFSQGNAANLNNGILPNARLNITITPQGRLTLTSGTPVLTSTVSGATSVIYALGPGGNLVPIYDGTNMTPTAVTELSNVNANSATGSAGPAAVANNSCYDYFVWSNSGTPTLTRGPAWTSTTARSAGTALTRVNGIWLNNASITNGPAASRGTYIGTGCSNGTATFDWILGASASGGTAASFGIWNYYNRVSFSTVVTDSGAGYTYGSGTVRQARASAGNQISFVVGLVEDGFTASVVGQVSTAATLGSAGLWGVGLNTTSSFNTGRTFGLAPTAASFIFGAPHTINAIPQLGLNVISANEATDGTTVTMDGNSVNTLSATVRM